MNDDDDKKKTDFDAWGALDPVTRARFLFIYKVIVTAALLGVVAVTHAYGLGPGLLAAAVFTVVF